MPLEVARTPRLDIGTPEEKRAEILHYFRNTWELYERLFDVMATDEAYFLRADPLRHPLVFYLGHTATFFINKLVLAKAIDERVVPRFESAFAIGVDEMSWDDLDESNYDWPTVAEVRVYRDQVREVVENVIANLPLTLPITWNDPFWVIMMGIEHERIHLETSSVLIRQLPLEHVKSLDDWPVCPDIGEAPANAMIEVPPGRVVLGKERHDPFYGWDNEYGRLEKDVPGFKAARFLVSNGEFKEFVDAGGYREEKWWSDEGWNWRRFRQADHPLFWLRQDDGEFKLRCFVEEIAMPWNWPVEVNQLEAKAFCMWRAETTGRPVRLPTEEEWYRLLAESGLPDQPDWDEPPANLNLTR